MGHIYTDDEREKKRRAFAKARHRDLSVNACCEIAGISVSTARIWNGKNFDKDDSFPKSRTPNWDKDGGWDK